MTSTCSGKPNIYVTHFIVMFSLLQWLGNESAIYLKYACMYLCTLKLWEQFNIESKQMSKHTSKNPRYLTGSHIISLKLLNSIYTGI